MAEEKEETDERSERGESRECVKGRGTEGKWGRVSKTESLEGRTGPGRTERRGDWKSLREGCDGAEAGAVHRLREPVLSRPQERKQTQKRRGCAKGQNPGRTREVVNEPLEGMQHSVGQRARLRKEVAC